MEERILLVEDDAEIARIIRDTLRLEGYRVTWATTGLEGWEDFQAGQYDTVLVDWMLPEMDGITLCKNIRLASDVPIIMISARNEDEDKVTGLDIGADDYVAKPFSLTELTARVAAQLRRWRRYNGQELQAEQTVYRAGLLIDWQSERAFLHNTEISLTRKEFELLKLLAQHPERVFSKEELYRHVWQQAELGETHTVTVHVKALREKLQDPVKEPRFIQTVWGKGYRFIGDLQ
ncbi:MULTISPECIES: response regulator transcription factor [Sporosarcina]|uniref:response regulator transcription factor n=1 Tax=Sporosarcina TaxID=1569 RepID=UPI00129AB44E|nr:MULTISPECIES: response regulator transcription factor [Sporosarcina]GKV67126.1 DNA-binding response regulator [Sporosarcina sp. NCCP-2331]GLB57456.1 DNA-binding response regulator [Sporosarcina sp. NCCP-2378]